MVAVVINNRIRNTTQFLLPILLGISVPLMAAILPEDRTDFLYHSYEGGGVAINGPSILVRKSVGEHVSLSYNFYIDSITSASVDVMTFGSPYTEKRTENDLSVEYLTDNTTLSLGAAHSQENDYLAKTLFFSISHQMFGDLTTVSLSHAVGSDTVGQRNNPDRADPIDRRNYKIDISQILTKSIVLNLGFEAITEEGALANPYRGILQYDPDDPNKNIASGELYPETRTSNAIAFRAMYYMPYRAKLYGEVRGFNDSWDISGRMTSVGYTQPIRKDLTIDVHYRVYNQSKASFFEDLVNIDEQKEFVGRDKELDAMSSVTTGVSLHYRFFDRPWWIFDKGSVNVAMDKIAFDYENYVNRSRGSVNETCRSNCPTYSFNADVFQLYMSVWY
ncbi:MAG: DUF3570 domain-containing protein [Thiohalomonadales bacterium]